jgi:hypothetical protein
MLDSGASGDCYGETGYGCIHTDQINWYKEQSQMLEEKSQKKVPALAFFHIPTPEVRQLFFKILYWRFYRTIVAADAISLHYKLNLSSVLEYVEYSACVRCIR